MSISYTENKTKKNIVGADADSDSESGVLLEAKWNRDAVFDCCEYNLQYSIVELFFV